MAMEDRRKQIIDAGLAILREEGLPSLTQPRIAARTGIRQGNLTYYYPTRSDLIAAVARAAFEIQLNDVKAMAARTASVKEAAKVMAAGTTRLENTRVLQALTLAAEKEPKVRAQFEQWTDDIGPELTALLEKLKLEPSQANADLVRGLFVGLSIMNLATQRPDREIRAKAALDALFALLVSQAGTPSKRVVSSSLTKSMRRPYSRRTTIGIKTDDGIDRKNAK